MNSKAEIIFDAITGIREHIVEEAQDYCFRRRRLPWRRYAGWVACLALAVCVGCFAAYIGMDSKGAGSAADSSGAPGICGNVPSNENMAPAEMEENDNNGEVPESDGAEYHLAAVVLEVGDGYLLVEPLEGEAVLASADRVMVSVAGLDGLPALQEGDRVDITFNGMIMETYPAQISALDVARADQQADGS